MTERKHIPGDDCWCRPPRLGITESDHSPRRSGFRSFVMIFGTACAVAWLLALLLFGFSVTDRDGKAAVALLLVLLSLAGSLFGLSAWFERYRYALLVFGVNVSMGALSVLSAVAVLT